MTLPLPRSPQRLVYLGTPDIAVPPLKALVEAGHDVVLVVTRADARRSRRGDLEPSPVKVAAQSLGIHVSHDVADVFDAKADLGIVVAYGRIISAELLAVVPMINMHFSLLPRWRGAAPVERAILAGDAETGVCIMDVAQALDEGDVYSSATVAIGSDTTVDELRRELVNAGIALLLAGLRDDFGKPQHQQGTPTYAAKMTQADRRLDFSQNCAQVKRTVAVGNAWTTFRGKRLKVHAVADCGEATGNPGDLVAHNAGWNVATKDGTLRLLSVQPEGKPAMSVEAWARGARLEPGDRLDS